MLHLVNMKAELIARGGRLVREFSIYMLQVFHFYLAHKLPA